MRLGAMVTAEAIRTDNTGSIPQPNIPDGILNVNKGQGCTSHDVVARLRRLLKGVKIGHAGTLDPAATGVLPVLVGKATRIAEYLIDWDKEYRALLRLGETTDTQDATGVVLTTCLTDHITDDMIRGAILRHEGRLTQIPPMYSAIKMGGIPLYKVARAGRTVEREARVVTIHRLEVLSIEGRDVSLAVQCSKGTYVRTLCADVGADLGVGGHLRALERRRVGMLTLNEALTVEEIEARVKAGRLSSIALSLDAALHGMPALILDAETAMRALHGVPVPAAAVRGQDFFLGSSIGATQIVRLKDEMGRLLGLGEVSQNCIGMNPGSGQMEGTVRILKVLIDR
jgi:tRNA pseudouridine55 synthase